MKKISILGSTGSIGRQTLEVISEFPDQFEIINAGLPWYTIDDITILFKKLIVDLKPDLVTIYIGNNDSGTLSKKISDLKRGEVFGVSLFSILYILKPYSYVATSLINKLSAHFNQNYKDYEKPSTNVNSKKDLEKWFDRI